MSAHASGLSGWFGKKKKNTPAESDASGALTASTSESVGSSQEPVVVWEAPNQMEAQVVVGRLKSEGIPAMIRGEAAGSVFGFTTGNLAATEVLVPAPLAEQAVEILESDAEWDDSEFEDESEPSEIVDDDGDNDVAVT